MNIFLLFLLLSLVIVQPAYSVVAFVQGVSAFGNNVSSVTTGNLTTTTGSLFVVDACYHTVGNNFVSITDSKSNTYATAIGELTSASESGLRARQSYKENGTGGATHNWTLTMDGAGYPTLAVAEISDAKTTGAVDRTASKSDNTGTSGTSSATSTTGQSEEIIMGSGCSCTANNATLTTTASGFTEDANIINSGGDHCGMVTAHRVVSAVNTYEYTWDADESVAGMIGMIGTYKEDIGAAATRAPRKGQVVQ